MLSQDLPERSALSMGTHSSALLSLFKYLTARDALSYFFAAKCNLELHAQFMMHFLTRMLVLVGVGVVLLFSWSQFYAPARDPIQDRMQSDVGMLSTVRKWQKESQINKVMGLVFYGKRETASILDCYLKVRVTRGLSSNARNDLSFLLSDTAFRQ